MIYLILALAALGVAQGIGLYRLYKEVERLAATTRALTQTLDNTKTAVYSFGEKVMTMYKAVGRLLKKAK